MHRRGGGTPGGRLQPQELRHFPLVKGFPLTPYQFKTALQPQGVWVQLQPLKYVFIFYAKPVLQTSYALQLEQFPHALCNWGMMQANMA